MPEYTKRIVRFAQEFKRDGKCDYFIWKYGKTFCALKSCEPRCDKCHVMYNMAVEREIENGTD